MSTEQPQSSNSQQGSWIERYDTASRIAHYPMVNSVLEYSKGWYNYAKENNSIVKYGLDITENTVGIVSKPIQNTLEKFDSYVLPIDKYSNERLEKIENQLDSVNHEYYQPLVNKTKEIGNQIYTKTVTPVEKGIETIDTRLDSIVGYSSDRVPTSFSNLVIKTTGMVDTVVDHLLPPQEKEDLDKLSDQELYALEKRAKFLLKLRKRTNIHSLISLPGNTVSSVWKLTGFVSQREMERLHETIGQLSKLSTSIQSASYTLADDARQKLIDTAYGILDDISAATASLVIYAQRFNTSEAIISIQELFKMVKDSKDNIMGIKETTELISKFKEDSSNIIAKATSLLQFQIDNSYKKINELKKSDYAIISQTVNILDDLVSKLTSLLSSVSPISDNNTPSKESTNHSQKEQ